MSLSWVAFVLWISFDYFIPWKAQDCARKKQGAKIVNQPASGVTCSYPNLQEWKDVRVKGAMKVWFLMIQGTSSSLHVCTTVVHSLRWFIQASNSGRFKRKRNPCKSYSKNFVLCLDTICVTSLFISVLSSARCSCRKYCHCQRKKVKEDKKRAKEQYDAFNKLESVGYYLDREQISSTATDSWTSARNSVY